MSDGFSNLAGRFGRQSVAYALMSVVGPGTGLLLLPVYTRYLEPADYGVIALLEVVALVLTAVFSLGMTALVPFLYVDQQDVEVRRRAFGTLVTGVTCVNVCLAGAFWLAGPRVIHYVLPSVAFEPNVPLVILTVLLEPYWVMAGAALQIQERATYLAIWSTVRIIVAGAIRVWFVAAMLAGVSGFITANLMTAALFAIVAAVILRTEVTFAFNPGVIRQALALGSPTIPNNLLSYGFRLVDRFFLERFATLEQIGLYYVALRVADVMRLCADTLINAWRPIFFKEGHNESFVRFDAPRVIRLAMVAIASLFVALSVFAREAMGLLAAPEYAAASTLVPVLVGAMALKSVQSFPYLVIWFRKRTRWVPLLTAATLAVGLAANWLFVPRWGAMGAATALVLSYASLTVIMFAVARRLHALSYPWREMTITAALGLATVLLAAQLNEGVLPLLWKLVLMACYGTALVATRCLPTDDLRALRSGAALVSIEGKA